jgi:hypothetical protein
MPLLGEDLDTIAVFLVLTLQIYEQFLNKLYNHLKKRKKMEITVTIKADKEKLSALNNKKEEKKEYTPIDVELLSQKLLQVLDIAQKAV